MKRVSFEIDETLLPAHSKEELVQWLEYQLRVKCQMPGNNPLVDLDFYDCVTKSVEIEKR